MDDATAFAVAMVSFWIGMGAYLLWLHRLAERLRADVATLRPHGRR